MLNPKDLKQLKENNCLEGNNIVQKVLDKIGGKWKGLIIFFLVENEVCRFGELRKKIPDITQRMLTLVLREMEKDGLVIRKVYAEVPPKVEYRLTEEAKDLKNVYTEIFSWGLKNKHIL